MTKDEAIDIVRQYECCKEHYEACELLIKLSEPCGDAVSRILERMWNCRGKHTTSIDKVKMEQIIRDELSVTPKSESVTEFADRCRECGKMRKGHWIYDETIENWRCSKCNETPKIMGYVGTADFMAEHFKFCNHCGAKMESEVRNEQRKADTRS